MPDAGAPHRGAKPGPAPALAARALGGAGEADEADEADDSSGDDVWVPEEILDERWLYDGKNAQRQYFMKWVGKPRPSRPDWTQADTNDVKDLSGERAVVKERWRAVRPRAAVPWVPCGKGSQQKTKKLAEYRIAADSDMRW